MDPERLHRIVKFLTIPITAVLGALIYTLFSLFFK
jgi:hypothetical protein